MSEIPSYELYGDLLSGGLPESIHHETIKERSSRHDWTIRLHRHRRLAQIFLFRSAGVSFRIGDVAHTSSEPVLLAIPPMTAHGFRFPEDIVGDVVSLRLDELSSDVQRHFSSLSTDVDMIFPASKTQNFAEVATLFGQLHKNYHQFSGARADILTAQVHLILLYLIGTSRRKTAWEGAPSQAERNRKDLQVEAFCALLEDKFQESWTVGQYAAKIGISAPHLTRICKAHLGAPPNNLVGQRRLLEAKRLLEYTTLSIAEIAHRCGFQDAAFFSRSFKSNAGKTPQGYRKSLSARSFENESARRLG